MNGRKVVGFIFLQSAFTRRNFTTLILVAIFFSVYVMSGGTISTAIPKLPDPTTFGGVPLGTLPSADTQRTAPIKDPAEKEKALEVLGVKPSAERLARDQAMNERGRLFVPDAEDSQDEKVDKNGLIAGDPEQRSAEEARLRKFEKRSGDSLAAIEERLNIKRH
ncbi:MAG: hypothetical protein U0136_16975 [Bdellovibrionota bacterium]